MAKYSDLEISDDDLALDDVQARIIYDRDVILQDLQHALRESGLLPALIGERSLARRKLAEQKIIALAEDDRRIVPSSVTLTARPGGYLLSGRTYEFGTFSEAMNYD